MSKREAGCPLCGARMSAAQLLDACEELIDVGLGVLSCHCPHCQGYLEALPVADRVDLGYLRNKRFDVVLSLPAEGLLVARGNDDSLTLRMAGRVWTLSA